MVLGGSWSWCWTCWFNDVDGRWWWFWEMRKKKVRDERGGMVRRWVKDVEWKRQVDQIRLGCLGFEDESNGSW